MEIQVEIESSVVNDPAERLFPTDQLNQFPAQSAVVHPGVSAECNCESLPETIVVD